MPYILLPFIPPMTAPSAAEDLYSNEDTEFVLVPTTEELLPLAKHIKEVTEANSKQQEVVAYLNGTLVAVIKLRTQAVAAAVNAGNLCGQGATAAADFCGQSTAAAVGLCAQGATAAANLPTLFVDTLSTQGAAAVVNADFAGKCLVTVGVAAHNSVKAYGRTIANNAIHIVADTFLQCGAQLKSSAGVEETVSPAEAGEAKEDLQASVE